jgi:hypothetical protein
MKNAQEVEVGRMIDSNGEPKNQQENDNAGGLVPDAPVSRGEETPDEYAIAPIGEEEKPPADEGSPGKSVRASASEPLEAGDGPPLARTAVGRRWVNWQRRYGFAAALLASLIAGLIVFGITRHSLDGQVSSPTRLEDVTHAAVGIPHKVHVSIDLPRPSTFVVEKELSEIGDAPRVSECSATRRQRWLEGMGAVPSGSMAVQLTLTTRGSQTVLVKGVEIHNLHRSAPIGGVNILPCVGEGGPVGFDYLDVDLDDSPPTVKYKDEMGHPTDQFAFTLTERVPEILWVRVNASDFSYRWTVVILLEVNGRPIRKTISDHGRPFVLTPRARGEYYSPNRAGHLVPSRVLITN